jgi:hypothetical protein
VFSDTEVPGANLEQMQTVVRNIFFSDIILH